MPLTHYLGNPDQLVIIIMPMEERFLPEDHGSQHTSEAPHVQADGRNISHTKGDYFRIFNKLDGKHKPVVIHLVVNQKLRSLEVPTGNPHIVLLKKWVKIYFCWHLEIWILLLALQNNCI